ncbi:Hypothetical protein CAP_6854 [Chondromyces apiculatus DSM 436]|uniref:Uncharacterized protein n=1 Tax=Chondromyces apiculatus DSM 436 TaxID=1192034 RepID=A0A017TFX7_9BACT|nr:Hypothetical protein CAP_6854 [Chondromyces apiculatus DSM 436]
MACSSDPAQDKGAAAPAVVDISAKPTGGPPGAGSGDGALGAMSDEELLALLREAGQGAVPAVPAAPEASPEEREACTMSRALPEACGACALRSCCSPPLAFNARAAMALGCRLGCRSRMAKAPPGPSTDVREAVIAECTALCGQVHTAPEAVVRFEGCLKTSCSADCMVH